MTETTPPLAGEMEEEMERLIEAAEEVYAESIGMAVGINGDVEAAAARYQSVKYLPGTRPTGDVVDELDCAVGDCDLAAMAMAAGADESELVAATKRLFLALRRCEEVLAESGR